MRLYAVHYAWVDGHAAKAPVGIWGEGGVSFYPEEWTEFRDDGRQAETESASKPWAAWVAMRSEFGSTYGASWRAVESDQSMETILKDLQKEFFAVAHPELALVLPDTEPETATSRKDEAEAGRQPEDASPGPAPRFILAQAWWIASELCRRRSNLRVVETWPMDGFYHGLEVGEAGDDRWVFMNLNGRIHMHGIEGHFEPVTWFEVMAAQSPHEVVRLVESRMSWDVSSADRTTPRSLTYRVLAGCLTQRLNDRNGWTVADGRTEAGDSDWAEGDSTFLSEFEGAHRSFWDAGGDREALARLWVLRSGERRVALLSDSGYLYRRGRPEVEMLPRYRARRALDDVTRLVLDEADDL